MVDPPRGSAQQPTELSHAEPALEPSQTTPPDLGAQGRISVQQLQVWQGQFPPPEAIERYERVLPGSFGRLMTMAERQQDAVIAGAVEARRFTRDDTRRGHWLGFSVTVLAMAGAVVATLVHESVAAGLFLSVPVLSVAKRLIDSARAQASAPSPADDTPPASE